MKPEDIKELFYIVHKNNLTSILQHGILSRNEIVKRGLRPKDISDNNVQKKRSNKTIPLSRRKLHSYANLYINVRNPMLYKLKCNHEPTDISVLKISKDILNVDGVIISDRNAASNFVKFHHRNNGLKFLKKKIIFTRNWIYSKELSPYELKSLMCAEILVPVRIDPSYIKGIYVANNYTFNNFRNLNLGLNISVNEYMFFNWS